MKYKRGYKYQLTEHVRFQTPFTGYKYTSYFISLTEEGVLTTLYGYAWDGASGPALDTKDFMVASLAHDALYQLISEGVLPMKIRKACDDYMLQICKINGMPAWRRWYVKAALSWFGWIAASNKKREHVIASRHSILEIFKPDKIEREQ